MFRTAKVQKNLLILIGILLLSYVVILLLSPKDMADYTITDTEYWRETDYRLLLKTAYEYNNKEDIQSFPTTIGDWKSYDFKYPGFVYDKLNADILMSRAYSGEKGGVIWMDIINSKVGESFHKQNICVEGAGWNVDNESVAEFDIAKSPNPYTKLYANRLDISKGNRKQVMVYWFMFKKFGSNDAVTMIRISSPVSNNVSDTFSLIKSFVETSLFDAMYKRAEPENITFAEYMIQKYGKTGMVAETFGILIPIGILFVGIRRNN